jgi:hypothetical protein
VLEDLIRFWNVSSREPEVLAVGHISNLVGSVFGLYMIMIVQPDEPDPT